MMCVERCSVPVLRDSVVSIMCEWSVGAMLCEGRGRVITGCVVFVHLPSAAVGQILSEMFREDTSLRGWVKLTCFLMV